MIHTFRSRLTIRCGVNNLKSFCCLIFFAALLGIFASVQSVRAQSGDNITGVYSGTGHSDDGFDYSLKLSIIESNDEHVVAEYVFPPDPDQPQLIQAFSMSGSYNSTTKTLQLIPVKWESAVPNGYTMLKLGGNFDPSSKRISGGLTYGHFNVTLNEPLTTEFQKRIKSPTEVLKLLGVTPMEAAPVVATSVGIAIPSNNIATVKTTIHLEPALIEAPIMDSDLLAANPIDPDRMAKGVVLEEMVPRVALKACQDAIAAHPKEARFRYELGRALAASGQYEEAVAAYRQAAGMNYRMAYYNLGLAYAEGQGIEKDIQQAKTCLSTAADAGVIAAKTELALYVFDSKGFSNPAFFQAIYDGNWKNIQGDKSDLATYLETFIEPIIKTSDCGMVISSVSFTKLAQQAQVNVFARVLGGAASARGPSHVVGDFGGAAAEGYHAGQQITVDLAAMQDKGRDDAQLFYNRYGCNSPVAQTFFGHLQDFANSLDSASWTHELQKYSHN